MQPRDSILDRVLRGTSDPNIPFADMCQLLRHLGFDERIRGSPHIFTKEGIAEILNVQPKGTHAKPYPVKQGRNVWYAKAYNSAADEASMLRDTGVRLVPIHKANMAPNEFADWGDLKYYRHGIEMRNSQLVARGLQQLHARTNKGISRTVPAALLALICSTADSQ